MEIPKELRDKFKHKEDSLDIARKKKQSTVMYKKRKLDKDIKKYIKNNDPIKYKEIERIQQAHGI